jgi:hypothetical protein
VRTFVVHSKNQQSISQYFDCLFSVVLALFRIHAVSLSVSRIPLAQAAMSGFVAGVVAKLPKPINRYVSRVFDDLEQILCVLAPTLLQTRISKGTTK